MSEKNNLSEPLVILMGSPRSGTTWLAKIVDSHPNILYRHEPDSINVCPEIPFVPETDEVERYLDASRDYLDLLQRERASKSSGSQPMFPKAYRGLLREFLRKIIIYSVKGGERILGTRGNFAKIQIPDLINGRVDGESVLFVKSVSSLCRTHMFSLANPDIKFIHILRHPCAYVASTLRGKKLGLLSDDAYIETLAKMSQATSYGFTLENLASMSREEQLASRWMLQNEKVMQEMKSSDNYFQVIYEDLCNSPLQVAGKLFAFLGLDMNEQSHNFIEQSSGGKTGDVSYFDVRRDSAKAAKSWMNELSSSQIDSIENVVSRSAVGQLYFAS